MAQGVNPKVDEHGHSLRPCGHLLAPWDCPECPLEEKLRLAEQRCSALARELQDLEIRHERLLDIFAKEHDPNG